MDEFAFFFEEWFSLFSIWNIIDQNDEIWSWKIAVTVFAPLWIQSLKKKTNKYKKKRMNSFYFGNRFSTLCKRIVFAYNRSTTPNSFQYIVPSFPSLFTLEKMVGFFTCQSGDFIYLLLNKWISLYKPSNVKLSYDWMHSGWYSFNNSTCSSFFEEQAPSNTINIPLFWVCIFK